MDMYKSRAQFAHHQVTEWAEDLQYKLKPISVLMRVSYPVLFTIFYRQSFDLLTKEGNVYRANY